MNENDFNGKTGKLVRARKAIYDTFEPNSLPLKIEYSEELISLLSEAILSLGNLSGLAYRMRNPHLLIMPYIKREAVLSSKIEGTRTSLSEVFLSEKEPKKEKNDDLVEVTNYIKALEYGLNKIKTEPISEDLIKDIHQILMKGARGEDKEPGRYKSVQNWIGSSYDIMEAKFVPCSPYTVSKLMNNLIEYLNNYIKSTPIIKSGVMHYQFETVHPFRDGNGRIGRLLITLFLCKSELLSQPLLYLSAYLEKHKEEYNNLLLDVSMKGNIEAWLKFFLKGIKIQADDAIERAIRLENYHNECREILQQKSQSNNVLTVLDHLFENPYIKIPEVAKILKSHYPTAENNIKILIDNGILKESTGKKRDRIFYAPKIREILEK
jgi:Fic family protein